MQAFGLVAALVLAWAALSQRFDALGLAFGAAGIISATVLTWRLRQLDRESAPYARALPITLFLGKQALAGAAEAAWVLRPGAGASAPHLVRYLAGPGPAWTRAILCHALALRGGALPVENESESLLIAVRDERRFGASAIALAHRGARAVSEEGAS